jgi:hypothetical protein
MLSSPIRPLVIIFLHYVARSFCEKIKLPKEMPKIILGILPKYAIKNNPAGYLAGYGLNVFGEPNPYYERALGHNSFFYLNILYLSIPLLLFIYQKRVL